MTLYQTLKRELEDHREFWNYYGENFEDVFQNEDAARRFIYDYFQRGSKLYAIDNWTNADGEYIQMRNVHTVNVFFIGAFLQRIIDPNIAINSEISDRYPFSYIWYLLCLAHDFGYVYEHYSNAYIGLDEICHYQPQYGRRSEAPRKVSRKSWYQKHGIDIAYLSSIFGERTKLSYYIQNEEHRFNSSIEYNNGTVIRRPRYSEKTKNNYFYYRIYEMNTLDHGIVGADEFFSRMILNYVNAYKKMVSENFCRGTFYEFQNESNHHFCSEQIKIFAYIADCIASHNMYKANNDEISIANYIDYALFDLMPNKFKVVSYEENPLLFILCVADTIEPSKKFRNYSNEDLLNRMAIEYEYGLGQHNLRIELDEKLYNSDAGQQYVAAIEQLKEWCNIKVRVVARNFQLKDKM